MKKHIAFLVLFLPVVFLFQKADAFTFGVKGGLNFANMTFKPVTADMPVFKNITGLTGGAFFSIDLGALGIQPEVLFSRRGLMYRIEQDSDRYKIEYLLNYVELPVLLKLNMLQAGLVKPVVFAGPCLSYLMSAKARLIYDTGSFLEGIEDFFKKAEFSAVIGAGLDFKLPNINLTIDARYHIGLSDVGSKEMEFDSVKNKGFSILVGIGF